MSSRRYLWQSQRGRWQPTAFSRWPRVLLATALVLAGGIGCRDSESTSPTEGANASPPVALSPLMEAVVGDSSDRRQTMVAMVQSRRLQRQGKPEEALAVLEQEVRRSPDAPMLHFSMGLSRSAMGDLEGAIRDFEREIELQPEHSTSYRMAAQAYTRLGRPEGSLLHLQRCLDLEPTDSHCALQLGLNFSTLGRDEEARQHVELAASLGEGAEAFAELGLALRLRGDLNGAASVLAQGLALDPSHLTILLNYGQVLVALGQTKEGETLLEQHRLADAVDGARPGNAE